MYRPGLRKPGGMASLYSWPLGVLRRPGPVQTDLAAWPSRISISRTRVRALGAQDGHGEPACRQHLLVRLRAPPASRTDLGGVHRPDQGVDLGLQESAGRLFERRHLALRPVEISSRAPPASLGGLELALRLAAHRARRGGGGPAAAARVSWPRPPAPGQPLSEAAGLLELVEPAVRGRPARRARPPGRRRARSAIARSAPRLLAGAGYGEDGDLVVLLQAPARPGELQLGRALGAGGQMALARRRGRSLPGPRRRRGRPGRRWGGAGRRSSRLPGSRSGPRGSARRSPGAAGPRLSLPPPGCRSATRAGTRWHHHSSSVFAPPLLLGGRLTVMLRPLPEPAPRRAPGAPRPPSRGSAGRAPAASPPPRSVRRLISR